jgi:hypothetical protein
VYQAFRDDEAQPVEYPTLRLHLSETTCKELAEQELGEENVETCTSGIQLRRYVDAAESKVRRALASIPFPLRKRDRSETPEKFRSSEEARYGKQEERAENRTVLWNMTFSTKSRPEAFQSYRSLP